MASRIGGTPNRDPKADDGREPASEALPGLPSMKVAPEHGVWRSSPGPAEENEVPEAAKPTTVMDRGWSDPGPPARKRERRDKASAKIQEDPHWEAGKEETRPITPDHLDQSNDLDERKTPSLRFNSVWLGVIMIVLLLAFTSIYLRLDSGEGVVGDWYGEFVTGEGENLSVTYRIHKDNIFDILVESEGEVQYDSTSDVDGNWIGEWSKEGDDRYRFVFQGDDQQQGVSMATYDEEDDRLIFPSIEGGRLELDRID